MMGETAADMIAADRKLVAAAWTIAEPAPALQKLAGNRVEAIVRANHPECASVAREIVVHSAEFVQHRAEFVEDDDRAARQNRVQFGQAVEGRRIEIAVDIDDDSIIGFEFGDELRP